MFAQKLSEEKSVQSNFRNKPPQKNEKIRHRCLKKHLYKKMKAKFYLNISEKNYPPNNLCRETLNQTSFA